MFCSKIIPWVSVLLKGSRSVLVALAASDVVLWSGWCLQEQSLPRDLKVSVVVVIAFIVIRLAVDQGSLGLPCCVCISLSHIPDPSSIPAAGNAVPCGVVRAKIATRRSLEQS